MKISENHKKLEISGNSQKLGKFIKNSENPIKNFKNSENP